MPLLPSERSRPSLPGAVFLCVVPVVIFYALLMARMRPVPMYDDYHAILAFVLGMREQHGLVSKLLFLAAAQHDEYKLVVEHVITAADYAVTGRVHFGFLIMTGNLMVLGIAGLFWANSFGAETTLSRRLLLFAPVCWLLFQLNYVENLDWAMCGLQTMPVLLFSLAALHFALRPGVGAAVLASASVFLACLSSANGFLVAPLATLLLLRSRRFRAALSIVATTCVALWIFLYRYQSFDPSLPYPRPSLGTKLLFFLSFVGGAVENMHHQPFANASLLLGLLLLTALVFVALRGRNRNLFVLITAGWCLLSAAAVAQGRSYLGVVMSLTGRYKIYSDLLLICCYLSLAAHLLRTRERRPGQRPLWAAVLVAAVLFAAAADLAGYRFLAKRQERVLFGLRGYLADPGRTPPEVSLGGEPFSGYEPEFTRQVLTQALAAQIYHLPTSLR